MRSDERTSIASGCLSARPLGSAPGDALGSAHVPASVARARSDALSRGGWGEKSAPGRSDGIPRTHSPAKPPGPSSEILTPENSHGRDWGGQDHVRRLSACEGKQAFANPKLARRVHQRRKRGHDRERREQEVYRCPCC